MSFKRGDRVREKGENGRVGYVVSAPFRIKEDSQVEVLFFMEDLEAEKVPAHTLELLKYEGEEDLEHLAEETATLSDALLQLLDLLTEERKNLQEARSEIASLEEQISESDEVIEVVQQAKVAFSRIDREEILELASRRGAAAWTDIRQVFDRVTDLK